MKQNVRLSVNPLAEFIYASDRRKQGIIKGQKKPNPVIVSWYRTAKSVMAKHYMYPSDTSIIEEGLKRLKETRPETKWQSSNKQGSIELLERFIKMKVPLFFKEQEIEFLKPKAKSVMLYGVEIVTSPEIMFRIKKEGIWYYGAVKFHTSKSGKFDRKKSKVVSTVLKMFLNGYLKDFDPKGKVNEDYCLCVDVFNEIITNAVEKSGKTELEINGACKEVIRLWDVA